MAEEQPEFCWHHSDPNRLRQCLDKGFCDLHGGERGIRWYGRHQLSRRIRVRFSVQGEIVAFGTIQSEPYDLLAQKGIEPVDSEWPSAVDINDICWRDGGYCDAPRRWGSHRL